MTLDDYLNAALARTGAGSDRALANALNIGHASISQFRTGRAWPSDDTMLALANLAGIDPATALLDLNTWRAKSETVREQYRAILAKVIAACFTVFVSGTIVEQVSAAIPVSIHYAMYGRARLTPDLSPTSHKRPICGPYRKAWP